METLQNRLERLLTRELKDGQTDLETLPNGHVCGHVISTEFKGKTYEQRRLRIKKLLEENLAGEELQEISTLLTYTPEEWAFEPKES